MAITIHLPAMLRRGSADTVSISTPVRTMGELIAALEQAVPGIAADLDDSVFNYAINDEMLLHGVKQHPIKDGDHVEIVPAISGG